MILTTTLCMAAAATIVNLWLSIRCGQVRSKEKIIHGDGGNPLLMQRMRAQANFIENTPLAVILVALVEIAGRGGWWLAPMSGVFILGRIAHGLGMDNGGPNPLRMIGTLTSMLILIALAIAAVAIAIGWS